MAYQVMFSGQSLEEIQKAAVDYVKTVPELKVTKVFVKRTDQDAYCTISLVKREPKK